MLPGTGIETSERKKGTNENRLHSSTIYQGQADRYLFSDMILKSQVYLQPTGCDMWCNCLFVNAEFNIKKKGEKGYIKDMLKKCPCTLLFS